MSIALLHPEDLLDKEARSELTDSERATLDAHCAECAACRAERRLRLDFAEERSEDGVEDAQFSSELIAIALGSAKAKKDAPAKTPSVRPAARPRRLARIWLLAAAALLGVTAAAANQIHPGSWLRRAAGIDAPVTLETNDTQKAQAPPTAPAPASVPAPTPVRASDPAPASERSVEDVAPPSAIPVLPIAAPSAAAPSFAAPSAKTISAATMFDDANDARRRGDYARAVDLHRQLETRYPSSREAQVSRATLGRLLLDRGDLASALASFDDYLAHGAHVPSELDETVMVGRATALDRLGRTTEARRAWQALLDAFPSSPYAEHARARTEP